MPFNESDINEIVSNTIPFPFFRKNENDEVVEACMITDMEGVDINKMPMTMTLEYEDESSVTVGVYQLVQSEKEFKKTRNYPEVEWN